MYFDNSVFAVSKAEYCGRCGGKFRNSNFISGGMTYKMHHDFLFSHNAWFPNLSDDVEHVGVVNWQLLWIFFSWLSKWMSSFWPRWICFCFPISTEHIIYISRNFISGCILHIYCTHLDPINYSFLILMVRNEIHLWVEPNLLKKIHRIFLQFGSDDPENWSSVDPSCISSPTSV